MKLIPGGNKELKICGRGIGGIWETRRKYKIPDFETVSQWEARKGCKYPDTAPLYALDEKVAPTVKPFYFLTDLRTVDKDRRVLIVATESGKPPDDWRPE